MICLDNFFIPSTEWTEALSKDIKRYTKELRRKDGVVLQTNTHLHHLKKEASLHLWGMIGTVAHRKRADHWARFPVILNGDFDPYIIERLKEIMPYKNTGKLIHKLAAEFSEWAKIHSGTSFPEGHAVQSLQYEKHGVDAIVHPTSVLLPLEKFIKNLPPTDSKLVPKKDG